MAEETITREQVEALLTETPTPYSELLERLFPDVPDYTDAVRTYGNVVRTHLVSLQHEGKANLVYGAGWFKVVPSGS